MSLNDDAGPFVIEGADEMECSEFHDISEGNAKTVQDENMGEAWV